MVFTLLFPGLYFQKKYKEDAEKSMSYYETVLDTPEMQRVRENQKNFSLVSFIDSKAQPTCMMGTHTLGDSTSASGLSGSLHYSTLSLENFSPTHSMKSHLLLDGWLPVSQYELLQLHYW
jgi:hypothetical protein